MPFEALALFEVNHCVVPPKICFLGITLYYSSLRTRGRKRFVIWSYNEEDINVGSLGILEILLFVRKSVFMILNGLDLKEG